MSKSKITDLCQCYTGLVSLNIRENSMDEGGCRLFLIASEHKSYIRITDPYGLKDLRDRFL